MPMPRPILAGAAVALGLAASACSGGDDPAATAGTSAASTVPAAAPTPAEAAVSIRTFIFNPDPITVAPGTTITFSNSDGTTHTVTAGTREAPQPEIIDASMGQGETATWTLTEPGTYDYYCRLHSGPGMTGQIVVS